MKRTLSAVTLVELIISTLIVSMVVIGVFSADYALRRMSETGVKDVTLNAQVQVIAESVRTAVRMLHGDFTANGTGYYFNAGTKTLCFRHDDASAGAFTPDNFGDDKHTCYTQIGTAVYTCERAATGACLASSTFVGSLVVDQFTSATILALGPTMATDPSTGGYYFEMTFVGRQDPSVVAAVSAGALTSGTDANPQVAVKIRENAAGF